MSIYASSADDNDPSIIYSGSGWVLVTEDGDWRGTMHSTSVAGSWARFRFTGSRVVVICTIPTGDGQLSKASFQIDDGPVIPVSHRTTPPVQWQTQFWNSGPLSFGSHLLTITNLDSQAYFRMDRIDFDPTDSNAPHQPSTPRPPPTPPPISPPNTSNPLSTPPISPTTTASQPPISSPFTGSGSSSTHINSNALSSSDSSQSSGLPLATSNSPRPDPIVITGPGGNSSTGVEKTASNSLPGIIAGVLGGILVLVIVGIGFYCLRRRRRRMLRLQSSEAFDGPRMAQAGEAGPMMPRPFTENGSSQGAGYSVSSQSERLLPDSSRATILEHQSKSRKPSAWQARATSPIPETAYSPDTTGSDIYVHSEVGITTLAVEGETKATLASTDQRLSINPSEAPPPAYYPSNS